MGVADLLLFVSMVMFASFNGSNEEGGHRRKVVWLHKETDPSGSKANWLLPKLESFFDASERNKIHRAMEREKERETRYNYIYIFFFFLFYIVKYCSLILDLKVQELSCCS